MKPHQQGRLISTIKWLVLLGIIAWAILKFPKKDWDLLVQQPKNWWLLLAALVVVLLANILSFWRWQRLLLALHVPISLLETVRLGFLGVAFNTVSAGSVGGDLFKAIAAANKNKDRKTEVITSVLVDRAVGLLGLVMVASISTSFFTDLSPQLVGIKNAAIALTAIGLAGAFGIAFIGKNLPLDWLENIPWVGKKLHRFATACLVFQNKPSLVLVMLLLSLGVHAGLTTAMWLVSCALYSEISTKPTLGEHFLAVPPALLAGTLPVTPGGIGLQEVWIDLLFKQISSVSNKFSGLIVATMFRVVLLVVALVGGVIYLSGRTKEKSTQAPWHATPVDDAPGDS